MAIFFFALLLILIFSIVSSYFIALKAHKKLKESNNENADVWAFLIFIISLIIIGGGVFLLVATNINFGR